jgi:hypothetical protein
MVAERARTRRAALHPGRVRCAAARRARDAASPVPLMGFLAASATVVGAIVIVGVTDSDWALAAAVALLLAVLGAGLTFLSRGMRGD